VDHLRQQASSLAISHHVSQSGFQNYFMSCFPVVFEPFVAMLPRLTPNSLSQTVWLVSRQTSDRHPGVTPQEWQSTTEIWSDDEAEAIEYLYSLAKQAIKYNDFSEDDL